MRRLGLKVREIVGGESFLDDQFLTLARRSPLSPLFPLIAVYTVPRLVHQVFLTTSVDMQSEVLTSVFMSMTKMVNDTSSSVRVSLATSAGQMLVLITKPDKSPEGEDERNSISSSDGAAGTGNGGVAATSPKGKRSMMNMMTGRTNKESTPVSNNPHLHYVDENILPVVQRLLHDTDPSVCSNALRAVANASHDINSKKADSAEVDFVPVLKEKQVSESEEESAEKKTCSMMIYLKLSLFI